MYKKIRGVSQTFNSLEIWRPITLCNNKNFIENLMQLKLETFSKSLKKQFHSFALSVTGLKHLLADNFILNLFTIKRNRLLYSIEII